MQQIPTRPNIALSITASQLDGLFPASRRCISLQLLRPLLSLSHAVVQCAPRPSWRKKSDADGSDLADIFAQKVTVRPSPLLYSPLPSQTSKVLLECTVRPKDERFLQVIWLIIKKGDPLKNSVSI